LENRERFGVIRDIFVSKISWRALIGNAGSPGAMQQIRWLQIRGDCRVRRRCSDCGPCWIVRPAFSMDMGALEETKASNAGWYRSASIVQGRASMSEQLQNPATPELKFSVHTGLESLWSMPKPLETSAKLHGVSVSREIISIERLDKKSRDDLQVLAFPMYCCKITIVRHRRPGLAQPLDRSRPAFWRLTSASSGSGRRRRPHCEPRCNRP
jgi:hypothetical protein